MSFRKYGSDPKGSEVHRLERKEAADQIKSARLDEHGRFVTEEEFEQPNDPEKQWTPLYEETKNDPPYSKGHADQVE